MKLTACFAASIAVLCCLVSPARALDTGRLGNVKVVQPAGRTRAVLIFFSDREGLTAEDDAAARALASSGALVAEIDTPAYLSRLDRSNEQCHRIVSDVELLSRGLQREQKLSTYLTPIVAGIGEGATLAELALSEAPLVTIAGALSLDPTPVIASRRPICAASSEAAGPVGFRYAAPGTLPGFWTVGLTTAARKSAGTYITALQQAGAPFELRRFGAGSTIADALGAMLQPHLRTPPGQAAGGVTGLPLSVLPVDHPSKLMAIVLSGDGGWRDLDRTIAEDLQARGVPVVGWDSLRYFWSKKTPAETADALDALIGTFTDKWHADKVALIGYSFGADVLPFAYNRLSQASRSHVVLIALLGFSKAADFQITLAGWLGEPPGPDALPTVPEAAKIPPSMLLCFYGRQEDDTACPTLAQRGVETIGTAGGHHFDGNYTALAEQILDRSKLLSGDSSHNPDQLDIGGGLRRTP
jgi:type IV secretory pathway VirJ component